RPPPSKSGKIEKKSFMQFLSKKYNKNGHHASCRYILLEI
ncbi:MAG: hypothetical protein ACI9S8_001675, partial [Chlamydiales bacterium]